MNTARLDTTPLTFGKYRGATPEQVADGDPAWLAWLYEQRKPGEKPCSRSLYLACVDAMTEDDDPVNDEEE